ncbi:MAG: general stress protein [Actinomycetes bacterium]
MSSLGGFGRSAPGLPLPPTGLPVGSYDTYEQAQRAVDFLSDEKFAVENVTIVGSDLQLVERVTGRLSYPRAAGSGAAAGAWWGLFVGVLLSFFGGGSTGFGVILLSLVYGAVFGVIFGVIGYSLTGGRRDFTSRTQVVARRYDVLCQHQQAELARELLARLSLRG